MKRTKPSLVRHRHKLTEQEIISALDQFTEAGNISVKEFVSAYQISEATFYNWRKRYRPEIKKTVVSTGFIDVDLSAIQKEQATGHIFAEYRGIVFYQRVEPSYLKSLL
jgi:hypothetical protein